LPNKDLLVPTPTGTHVPSFPVVAPAPRSQLNDHRKDAIMTAPLNPSLFHALQARFGEVRVTNAGQQRVARRVPDPMRPGRFITQATQRGEQYALSCPFCNDERQRLYVSCMYGQKDPTTGRRNHSLWFCQNEQCHRPESNRRLFRSMVAVPLGRRGRAAPMGGTPEPVAPHAQPHEIVLPEGLIPINILPPTHPAAAYLIERGFDLDYLARASGVTFCDWCLNCRPIATNRIVAPVYRPSRMFAPTTDPAPPVLAGWQARAVPGLGSLAGTDAKYVSSEGMQKAELLYGLLPAIESTGPVCLVEGATDCWRIGPGSVAVFGKSLSTTQRLLLVHHFVGRPIVVMLDREAIADAQRIQHELALARGNGDGDNRVVIGELPAHRDDPADCTRDEIDNVVRSALGPRAWPQAELTPSAAGGTT